MADILLLLAEFSNKRQEHIVTITVDSGGRFINKRLVFLGTVSSSICHPREVFSGAVEDMASGIYIAHNHPSGDPTPSRADKELTKRLQEAGAILDIPLLDHIIIAANEYVSFVETGLMDIK
jgi:DNA repair protein RadC